MAADAMSASQARAYKDLWWVGLVQGIAAILLGVLFLTYPAATAVTVAGMVGFFWLVGGVVDIVQMFMDKTSWGWKLFSGVIGILAGLLVLSNVVKHPLYTAAGLGAIYVFVLGIQGVIIGVIQVVRAFQGEGWGVGALGVLSVLFGLLLMFNSLAGALALPLVFGVLGIVFGIVAIVMAFRVKNA